MDTQRQIDFPRAEKLAMLDRVRFGRPPRGTPARCQASEAVCKAVLKVIDGCARFSPTSWPGEDLIAARTGYSARAVRRAVARLQGVGILAVADRGRMSNLYAIVWTELALMVQRQQAVSDAPIFAAPRGPLSGHPVLTTAAGCEDRVSGCEDRVSSEPFRSASEPPPLGRARAAAEVAGPDRERPPAHPPPAKAGGRPAPVRDRPPPRPASGSTDEESLRRWTIQRLLRAAKLDYWEKIGQEAFDLGRTVPEVAAAVRTMDHNQHLFRSPRAALAEFLRTGNWPADGVVTVRPVDPAALSAARDVARAEAAEKARADQAAAAVHAARDAAWSALPPPRRAELIAEARSRNGGLLARLPDDSLAVVTLAQDLLDEAGVSVSATRGPSP